MEKRKFYIETYGCQMNVADSELVAKILTQNNYEKTEDYKQADVVMINTCAVRESAEDRIIGRLSVFIHHKKKNKNLKVGVLGCMAQRLKDKMLEENQVVDFLSGPDTYRRLVENIEKTYTGERITDVVLNKEENYDDIIPLHLNENGISGFVTISRGCDNMCSFCIVPFTRGRERSRNPENILREIEDLQKNGFKEVTLLGQNVDKYNWNNQLNFAQLLQKVAIAFPDLRIRFATSYPQDMTDEVLYVIAKFKNVCKYVHLPVQAGSTRMLQIMRRGYTREWYLNRIDAIKRIIPDCAISTDLIAGFCGETEDDHLQTLDLMQKVGYDYAYMFKYSERPNTFAARNLPDDVSEDDKQRRLAEIIELQTKLSIESNKKDVGKTFDVLVEGHGRKSETQLYGRNSQNKVVVFEGDSSLIGQTVNVSVYDYTQATLFGKLEN